MSANQFASSFFPIEAFYLIGKNSPFDFQTAQSNAEAKSTQRFGGQISIEVFGWQFVIDANNCKISSAKLRVLRASAFKAGNHFS